MISALHQISPLKQHIPRCKPTLTRGMKKQVTNKMHSTLLTFFLNGRNCPTSVGLTAITTIVNISIGILRRLSRPSLEEPVLPTEQRASKDGGITVSGWPRVDVRTSLTEVLVTTGKMVETAGNTTPEQTVTPAVITETVRAEVVPG